MLKVFEEKLKLTIPDTLHQHISTADFDQASHLFYYLIFCSVDQFESPWISYYDSLFEKSTLKDILLSVGKVQSKPLDPKDGQMAGIIMEYLVQRFNLQHKVLDNLILGSLDHDHQQFDLTEISKSFVF